MKKFKLKVLGGLALLLFTTVVVLNALSYNAFKSEVSIQTEEKLLSQNKNISDVIDARMQGIIDYTSSIDTSRNIISQLQLLAHAQKSLADDVFPC